jgi:cytochrome c556
MRSDATCRRRGRVVMLAIAAAVTVGRIPATAQDKPYPVFTAKHFVAAMKTVGQAFAAVDNSLAKGELEDSKAYLAISRDRLATTITFWRDRKRDDAVRILRDTLKKMDELDAALSVDTTDAAAVRPRAAQVLQSCEACHAIYREQDPVTKAYRLKMGIGE